MSKEHIKKITLEDFISRKEQRARSLHNPQPRELYIKSLDGCIEVVEPTLSQLTDARKLAEESEEMGNAYIVYQCCPILHAGELKTGGAPHEAVFAVFKPGEVAAIAAQLMEMAGYSADNVTVAERLKN